MPNSKVESDGKISLVREFSTVRKFAVDRERVTVRTTVETADQLVEALLRQEDVTVEHVAIGVVIETAPAIREVDGVTIIPVVEERLVTRTELVLREELHIRRVARLQPSQQTVRLRREVVAIERHVMTPINQAGNNTMAMDSTTPYDADMAIGAGTGTAYDPTTHDNQIVAMYETRAEAQAALDKLTAEGLGFGAHISEDRPVTAGGAVQDEGLWSSVKRLFAPEDEVHGYTEGLRRGHALLIMHPAAEMRSRVIDALESTNPIDLDTKVEEWRQQGWSETPVVTGHAAGYATPSIGAPVAAPAVAVAPVATTATGAIGAAGDTIEVMEERLRVGKREVARGGVRVRSYVVERPVEEAVTLHEESVTLDRRPVDRVLAPGEAAFQDRTVEVIARGEEAVVDKHARVVEEISLHKTATDRKETIRDTVRHTEVEVDDSRVVENQVAPATTPVI